MSWSSARTTPITPDWSPRSFTRLYDDTTSRTAIRMHAPAAIPGHGLADFIRLSGIMHGAGLSTPEIFDIINDETAIIEDFGETPIDTPGIETQAYEAAVDALATLRNIKADIVSYKDGYIFKKLSLFSTDPAWLAAWTEAESMLPPCPLVFSHMDYKAGNLHWLPERAGIRRVGILDFQAAQMAPFTYDIVNLLEDARRDLDPGLKSALKQRFRDQLPADWKPLFADWYIFMSAQFHARVLGQIQNVARVSADVAPRLRAYLENELAHPALAPVRAVYK